MKKHITYTMIGVTCDDCSVDRRDARQGRDGRKGKSSLAGVQGQERTTSKRSWTKIFAAFTPMAYPNVPKELADMQKWDMKSFAISDYKSSPMRRT